MRTTTTGQTISCEAAGCSEPVAVKLHTVPLCARHAAECLLPDTGHGLVPDPDRRRRARRCKRFRLRTQRINRPTVTPRLVASAPKRRQTCTWRLRTLIAAAAWPVVHSA